MQMSATASSSSSVPLMSPSTSGSLAGASSKWPCYDLPCRTTEEYKSEPLPWGGSRSNIKWVGQPPSAQRLSVETASAAFGSTKWGSQDDWSPAAVMAYKTLLSKHLSLDAVRLMLAIQGIDPKAIQAANIDKEVLVAECIRVKVPFSTPEFLLAWHTHYATVAAGSSPGGVNFTEAPPADTEVVDQEAPQEDDGVILLSMRTEMADLKRQLLLAREKATVESPMNLSQAQMGQMMSLTTTMAASMAAQPGVISPNGSKHNGEFTPPPRPKNAWRKLGMLVRECLVSGETPPIQKLCRANHEKLKREAKVARSATKFVLGNGASISLPSEDVPASTATACDDVVWSGMSAFFRLFQIMASLSEEEFSRQSMRDLLNVWSELWDSPNGTRAQKMEFAVAFYDKNIDTLGKGKWAAIFDSDARFLLEHLAGKNPSLCRCCGGSGELSAGGCPNQGRPNSRSTSARVPSTPGEPGGARNQRTPKRKSENPCFSMLQQDGTCANPATCNYLHSPCPSCKGSCASAAVCVAWDEVAVKAKYGALINAIRSPKRRKRNGQ